MGSKPLEIKEPVFYLGEAKRGPEPFRVGRGLAVAATWSCPGADRPNEDALAIFPVDAETVCLAVADGVGGAKAGAEASSLVLTAVSREIENLQKGREGSLRDALLRGVDRGNEAILKKGIGAATTLAMVEIRGSTFRSYHAGDSTVVQTGLRGKLKLQTVSHSPVGYAVEAGYLSEEEALHHEDLNLVSNVVGSDTMHLEMGRSRKLHDNDTLLLGSDGLFDNLSVSEIIEWVRKGDLHEGVEALVQAARDRMENPIPGRPSKPDDLTLVAFRLG